MQTGKEHVLPAPDLEKGGSHGTSARENSVLSLEETVPPGYVDAEFSTAERRYFYKKSKLSSQEGCGAFAIVRRYVGFPFVACRPLPCDRPGTGSLPQCAGVSRRTTAAVDLQDSRKQHSGSARTPTPAIGLHVHAPRAGPSRMSGRVFVSVAGYGWLLTLHSHPWTLKRLVCCILPSSAFEPLWRSNMNFVG
jgi:hypothetical protein